MSMSTSLNLPDKTLQFIRDHQLMDEGVQPMTGGPLLVTKGPLLTRIVVDNIMALDGHNYPVMFVGTGKTRYIFVNARYPMKIHVFVLSLC